MEGLLPIIVLAIIAYVLWRVFAARSRVTTVKTLGSIRGLGAFACDVVGESHYQDNIEHIAGGRSENGAHLQKRALLVLEDDNPHDKNAVCVRIDGLRVGYLPRELAAHHRRQLKRQNAPLGHYYCEALIVGGWDRGGNDRGYFGVRLDIPIED